MNIQERIEALETEFDEKIKALKAEVQRQDEFPQDGDKYHFIVASGGVDWLQWDESGFGLRAQDIGNIFRTKEQAEFAVEKLKVEAELRKFSVPIFKGCYYIYMMAENGSLALGVNGHYKSQGTIYFESNEKAQQAIRSVGEERIKKYIFGVED